MQGKAWLRQDDAIVQYMRGFPKRQAQYARQQNPSHAYRQQNPNAQDEVLSL